MSETIEDIVRKMREHADFALLEFGCDQVGLRRYADRIEAASTMLEHEMNDLCDENARLRAALKPVLECPDRWHGHWPFAAYASDAVKEAQRIYKESEEVAK